MHHADPMTGGGHLPCCLCGWCAGPPEVLDQLQVGAEVWIDEGKLGTQVEAILPEGLLLRVIHAREKGERLRSDKGLNFPATELHISPLTEMEIRALDLVASHADIVGYSFVQEAAAIDLLWFLLPASIPHRSSASADDEDVPEL